MSTSFWKKVKKVDILAGGGIIEAGIINNNINPPCEGFWLSPKAGGLTSPPKDFSKVLFARRDPKPYVIIKPKQDLRLFKI